MRRKTQLVADPSPMQRAVYALLESETGLALANKAGIRESTLRRFLTTPGATMRADTLQKLADAAGKSVEQLLSFKGKPKARLSGRVGAGAIVYMFPGDVDQGDSEEIDAPEGIDGVDELFALEIEGDSMRPLKAGWRVFYRADQFQPPDQLLGRLCIVKLRNGGVLLKEIARGYEFGRYNLTSWNADPMNDEEIVAAAPVLAIVPR